jgi:murein L,D-transpeptidase YafK
MRILFATFLAILILAGGAFAARQIAAMRPNAAVARTPEATPGTLPIAGPTAVPALDGPARIKVFKGRRELMLVSGGRLVKTYRIALGPNPVGRKTKAGDGRTPEGEYYVCVKNPRSKYYLSLGLSYPDDQDAAAALEAGAITPAQASAIHDAVRRKAAPPWDTPLGGEIFIHGSGAARDWTLGCIALENDDMRELFDAVGEGAAVTIHP